MTLSYSRQNFACDVHVIFKSSLVVLEILLWPQAGFLVPNDL